MSGIRVLNNRGVHFKIMATRSKSSSGAYMSQYDNEVEKRLTALESHTHEGIDGSEVQDLKKTIFENAVSPERLAAVEKKVNKLIEIIDNELHPSVGGQPISWDE